jgi:hypothetical protein
LHQSLKIIRRIAHGTKAKGFAPLPSQGQALDPTKGKTFGIHI